MGDQTVGLQARMMSQAMRKLAGNLNRANTLCIFTNQIREKVGVMFGSPETQPGGRALKFYSSQRLDIRRIETLKEGTEAVGNRVRVKVVKNKVAAPFRQAEFDIEYGQGISAEGCLLDLGIEHDIVQKSGSFFSYGDERLGQGRNNAKEYLRENPSIAYEIERKIYEALGVEPGALSVVEPPLDAEGEPADGGPRQPTRGPTPRSPRNWPHRPRRAEEATRETKPRASGRSTWPTRRSPVVSSRLPSCARAWSASAFRPRPSTTPSRSSRPPASWTTPATRASSPRTSASSTSGGASGSRAISTARGIARHLIEEIVSTRSRDSGAADRRPAAGAAPPVPHRRTIASGTALGRCWCAAATRRDRLRRDQGVRAARRESVAAPHRRIHRLPVRPCVVSWERGRRVRRETQKTSISPDFMPHLNLILTTDRDQPERSVREGPWPLHRAP